MRERWGRVGRESERWESGALGGRRDCFENDVRMGDGVGARRTSTPTKVSTTRLKSSSTLALRCAPKLDAMPLRRTRGRAGRCMPSSTRDGTRRFLPVGGGFQSESTNPTADCPNPQHVTSFLTSGSLTSLTSPSPRQLSSHSPHTLPTRQPANSPLRLTRTPSAARRSTTITTQVLPIPHADFSLPMGSAKASTRSLAQAAVKGGKVVTGGKAVAEVEDPDEGQGRNCLKVQNTGDIGQIKRIFDEAVVTTVLDMGYDELHTVTNVKIVLGRGLHSSTRPL